MQLIFTMKLKRMLGLVKRAVITEFQYLFLGKTGYGDNLLRLRKFRVYHKKLNPAHQDKILFLTLDVEKWNTPYFTQMLDTLKERGVSAYLFLLGEKMEEQTELLQRLLAEGHCVGNHTMTHRNLTQCAFDQTLEELKQCEELYYRLTGEKMAAVLRPPYGRINRPLAKNLYKAGYTVMHWSLHVPDLGEAQPVWEDYETYYHQRLHNGGVILQHSFSPGTAENLGKLIDFCREQGYRFAEKKDYDAFLQLG